MAIQCMPSASASLSRWQTVRVRSGDDGRTSAVHGGLRTGLVPEVSDHAQPTVVFGSAGGAAGEGLQPRVAAEYGGD